MNSRTCTNLCVRVVHLEVGNNDWDGQGHREDSSQGTESSDKHAQVGLGHHVAVAHCGHRHQRPPQAQRDRLEVVGGIDLRYISLTFLVINV